MITVFSSWGRQRISHVGDIDGGWFGLIAVRVSFYSVLREED
jgi:hypothetical protein